MNPETFEAVAVNNVSFNNKKNGSIMKKLLMGMMALLVLSVNVFAAGGSSGTVGRQITQVYLNTNGNTRIMLAGLAGEYWIDGTQPGAKNALAAVLSFKQSATPVIIIWEDIVGTSWPLRINQIIAN